MTKITFIPAAGRPPRLGLRRIRDFKMGAANLLGQGSMGAVYGERGRCEIPVAIKVGQPDMLKRNEAAVLAQLRHPHIIDFFGQGILSDNSPFIAMEYFDQAAFLPEIIKQNNGLGRQEAFFVTRCIASALAHLHALGLVHADLKPDNIFYESRARPARVKLFDFGLARPRDKWLAIERSADGLSFLRYGVGAYMNVGELADRRPPKDEDDIFALGLVLFAMVTGQRAIAYNSETRASMKNDLMTIPQRLETFRVDPITRELILRMLGLGDKPRIISAQAVVDFI